MIRPLLLPLLLTCALGAVTLEEIDSYPSGRAKNFYIWQYFKQDITPEEADRAFYQIENVSSSLFRAYAKKSDRPDVRFTAECMQLSPDALFREKDRGCAQTALSPYRAAQLSPAQRRDLAKRLLVESDRRWLELMADSRRLSRPAPEDAKAFLNILSGAGSAFRRSQLNRIYPADFVESLSRQSGFERAVTLCVSDHELDALNRSWLAAPYALSAGANFYLALNALRYGRKGQAIRRLETAYRDYYYRMDKNKALFWLYRITEETHYLKRLAQSPDINVYTLYAAERLGLKPAERFVYHTTLEEGAAEDGYDMRDPFAWKKTQETIRTLKGDGLIEYARRFKSARSEPIRSLIRERASGYRDHGYLRPYEAQLAAVSNEKRSLVYALMRQESRFIPASISSAYALGLMQLMPFLVEDLSRRIDAPVQRLDAMFEPSQNLRYALRHLEDLERWLSHPLFIAYAYNGGIGFTKRYLLEGRFDPGPYEPFWSMEMMSNSETREYGKKVLANYVMYRSIYGEPVSIIRLFDTLTQPSRTDRFRAPASAARTPAAKSG